MRRPFLVGLILMLITAALTAFLIQPRIDPTTAIAKNYLRNAKQSAQAVVDAPSGGDIIHYTTQLYWRSPADAALPDSPYHLPDSGPRASLQIEETWIEISPAGMSGRWRTLLYDYRGALLQDLYFDGTTETDYFPAERRVMRFTEQAGRYQDERIALFDAFMNQDRLRLRENTGLHGRRVMSIYGHKVRYGDSPEEKAAVRNTLSPYMADLNPVSQQLRLDIDPATHLPIALVTVVWDPAGGEHITAFRTLPEVEHFSLTAEEIEALFRQDIPARLS